MPGTATTKTRNPAFSRSRTRRPSLAMHSSQCSICRHPERAEIERAFLDWTSPGRIAREYDLGCRTTIYRHAHALGLFARRERSLRFALGRLIERVDEVRPTAASVVSAIRLMAKLNAHRKRNEKTSEAELLDLPDDSALDTPPDETEQGAFHKPAAVQANGTTLAPTSPREQKAGHDTLSPCSAPASGVEHKNEKHGNGCAGPPLAFAQNVLHRHKLFRR